MDSLTGNNVPLQNIGLIDHGVRLFLGATLITYGFLRALLIGNDLLSAAAILVAIYPLITTIIGHDPFYQLIGKRSCSLKEGRNQCGTFGYEVKSALGDTPRRVMSTIMARQRPERPIQ